MSQFIRTSVGFLNLDHILLVRVRIEKEDEGLDLVQMSDGRNVQCLIYDRAFFPPEKPPAALGAATTAPGPKHDVEPAPETEV